MIDSLTLPLPALPTTAAAVRPTPSANSFADALKSGLADVAQMQADAANATNALATGQTNDLSGVMTTVEKGDLAFKTLLAVRSKLVDAYDELKSMPI